MNYAAQQWTSDLSFEVLDKISAKKIFVPCGYSGFFNPSYKKYFQNLPNILKKYNTTIYLSHNYRDINFAKKHKLKNIKIIPNGADEREFRVLNPKRAKEFRKKFGINENEKLLLNVSNHTGMKGHRETISAFLKADISNVTLMIIGHGDIPGGCTTACKASAWINNNIIRYLSNNNKRVMLTQLDRKETIIAYQAADLFLFLSNIECSPLVLFEASAAGLPFISSDIGNASEIAKWTKAGYICETRESEDGSNVVNITQVKESIKELLYNPKKLLTLSNNGRASWNRSFTWEEITKEYLKLYKGKR